MANTPSSLTGPKRFLALRKVRNRLVNIALPRVRDFRGLSVKSFDGAGNFSIGLKEQIIFPEIDYDKVDDIRGLDIVICTSARTNAEAQALLKGFDMPFTARDAEKEAREAAAKRAAMEAERKAARDAMKEAEEHDKEGEEAAAAESSAATAAPKAAAGATKPAAGAPKLAAKDMPAKSGAKS